MAMQGLKGIFLLLLVCKGGHSRRDGSIPNSACSSMLPGHGTNRPQGYACPYVVEVESVFFIRNLSVAVYAENITDSPPFKGFYCQARRQNQTSQVAGYFLDIDSSQRGHSCFSSSETNGFDTISHNITFSNNPESFTDFNWKVTDPNVESVKFRCTFVQSFSVFWVGVESETVTSIESKSVSDCCYAEGVASGCQPLCRDIHEEPVNVSHARTVLVDASKNTSICPFQEAQLALRCTYWAQTAENFDDAFLEECCNYTGVSSDCMFFCSKEILGTMDYSEDEMSYCLERNPGMASCLLFPASNYEVNENTSSHHETKPGSTSLIVTTPFHGTSTTWWPSSRNSASEEVTRSENPDESSASSFDIVTSSSSVSRPTDTMTTVDRSTTVPTTTTQQVGLSAGAIAGIIVGCLTVLVIVIIVVSTCHRKRWDKDPSNSRKAVAAKKKSLGKEDSYAYPTAPYQTEPIYMDISDDTPSPPTLPPSRLPTLPSHSLTYDAPNDDEKSPTRKLTDLQENEEGYMVPVSTDAPATKRGMDKESSDYTEPYEIYQANDESKSKNLSGLESSDQSTPEKVLNPVKNDGEAMENYIALDGYEFANDAVEK